MERRLTTILAADVVGYSRLMGADEAGTLATLKAHRADLLDPKAAQHGGRVIKLMGDGILMEFASVVDAVSFAIDVQHGLKILDDGTPEDRQILYRIGINIGDVIVEDDDIYGDGVNVAARLEGLADAGGVCIGLNVRDQIRDKLDLNLKDLGEVEVKNIARPVRAFQIVMDDKAGALSTPVVRASAQSMRPSRKGIAAVMAALLLVVSGAAVWWQQRPPEIEPARVEAMALPLPDKPSIAVLPFNNMSEDASQEYFADGMTEDLITDLSKISGLFVIARNSSFSFKGKQVKVRQVAEELGVRYVLEGSVRRAGDQVRINAQLIDATTGGHLWAERYDGTSADVFALQDKVTRNIVNALAVQLTPKEVQQVAAAGTIDTAAYDAYLRGLSYYNRRTPTDNAVAKTHFERAIQLDSNYSAAYTALAKVYVQAILGMEDYSEKLRLDWFTGTSRTSKYLQMSRSRPDKDYFIVRSRLALKRHQPDRAIAEAKRALEFNSNDSEAMEVMAEAQIYAGQPKEGIEFAQQAMRQNPAQLGHPLYLMGLAEFSLGNTEAAAKLLERALRHSPNEIVYSGVLAAAYGELGQTAKAKSAYSDFLRQLDSPWILHEVVSLYPFSNSDVLQRFANGLKGAGVKVQSGEYLSLSVPNRLSGPEIKSLLFGTRIQGRIFWERASGGLGSSTDGVWRQHRTPDGKVQHFGFQIQPGVDRGDSGSGRIEQDALCEIWPKLAKDLEICVAVFRVTERIARIKWGDYVMVTDSGPHPFSLAD